MVQILLMLKVLFIQGSEAEDLFCGASPNSEPSLFFSNNLFSLGFEPVQDDFQHDFTWITDDTDGSIVLAELWDALLRECNNSAGPKTYHPGNVTDVSRPLIRSLSFNVTKEKRILPSKLISLHFPHVP